MTIAEARPEARSCLHCGLPARPDTSFCCAGCASVYSLLAERGLGHFYQLQRDHSFLPPKSVSELADLPSPAFAQGRSSARFYLEGVHCLGCLWLLEKLPEIEPRIRSARLDLHRNILEVGVGEGISWTEVSAWIQRLGYSARAIDERDGAADEKRSGQGRQLSRLGVAAFCAGNIMLLSVSVYAGAEGSWALLFAWLSLALAVPALTYSAWPIYRSALGPLRHGRVSIDLPIVFALLAGVAAGMGALARGEPHGVYFDSLTMLVFLLLASRYLLQRMREALAEKAPCLSFLSEEYFQLLPPSAGQAPASGILPGQRLWLRGGQVLPVDSILEAREAHFDLSLLTGESLPVKVRLGETVEAGARLEGKPAELRAVAVASESRLARILEQIRAYELHRSPSLDFAERIGRRFVAVVLTLAGALLLWNPEGEGLQRALALAIVTCPCVLAFAIPLTLTRALQECARRGILFRDSAMLEKLASVRHAFLDKTGTLTTGEFRVREWKRLSGRLADTQAAVAALERHSSHPVARAIVREVNEKSSAVPAFSVEDILEVPGVGIEGSIEGRRWRAARSEIAAGEGENRVDITCDGQLRAEVVLGDSVRPEAGAVVGELVQLGLEPELLSGDHAGSTGAVAKQVGIRHWRALLRPEEKASLVSTRRDTVMVGDGANDAVAFRAAGVSVAMQGAADLSLRHADVLLTRPGLSSLPEAIRISRRAMRLVKANFAFTLLYNLAAGALAVGGHMQPLLAAVLMPLSALTVFLFTTWQTSRKGAV